MFADETLDAVEFKSTWKKDKYVRDTGMQTKELSIRDRGVQSVRRSDQESQTEEEIREDIKLYEDDSTELITFLKRMEPLVSKEIEKNLRSHAFDGYTPKWEDETGTVTCVHTLSHADSVDKLPVSGLSWNSTGSVIAVSYGRFDHEDWCTHKSMLCSWNLSRRNVDPSKADFTVDLPCCLMSVACHPRNPSWIAGGTFNGEVIVWDTGRTDDVMIATSGIGDDSHREPVSKLQWILDPESKGQKFHLVSAGNDGRILVWQQTPNNLQLKLINGFVLLSESLPRELRAHTGTSHQMGVTGLSFSHDDQTSFLISSESGGIFRCSTQQNGTVAKDVECSIQLRSPVCFTFSTHQGPVHGLDSSPFHRNLFISCSTDTSIRIYSLLQSRPLLSVEPNAGYLYSVSWSPVRPLVVAVSTSTGMVLVYDLQQKRSAPVLELDASPNKTPVYSLQFNSKQTQLLATGDGLGNIKIWKLNDELTKQTTREQTLLEQLASSALE